MQWVIVLSITIIGFLLWWGLSRAQQTFRYIETKPTHYVIKPRQREFIAEFSEEIASIKPEAIAPAKLEEMSIQQHLDLIEQTELYFQKETLIGLTNMISHTCTELVNVQLQLQDLEILTAINDDFQQAQLSYPETE